MTETLKNDVGILILRLFSGGLMLTHGWPKLMKLFAGAPFKFADPIGIGVTASLILTVFSEFICAILVMVGYKTRWFVVPLIITMIVAAFIVHWPDPFGRKEKGILYLVTYVVLLCTGSGKFSLDKMLSKN